MPTESGETLVTLSDGSDVKDVRLIVRENGDNSVRASISEGYVVVQDLPDIADDGFIWVVDDIRAPEPDEPDIFDRLLDVYLDGRKLTGGKLAEGEQAPDDWEYYARPGGVAITIFSAGGGNGQSTLSVTFMRQKSDGSATNAVDTVSTNFFSDRYDPQTEQYPFSDGTETRYRDAIRALAESGIVGGFEDGSFRSKSGLTRAQDCVILARAIESGNANGTAPFSDTSNHWAEGAIAWCASNGIISGYGNGTFGPDDPLTGYA